MSIEEQDRITGSQLRALRNKEQELEHLRAKLPAMHEALSEWSDFFLGGIFSSQSFDDLPSLPDSSDVKATAKRLVELTEEARALRMTLGIKEEGEE